MPALVVDAINTFQAGIRNLLDILADFDSRDKFAVLLDRDNFINRAEDRLRLCSYQPLADAKRINRRALTYQRSYREFVEAI